MGVPTKRMTKEQRQEILEEGRRHPFRTVAQVCAEFGMSKSAAGAFSARYGLAKIMRQAKEDRIINFVTNVNNTLSVAAYARRFEVSESYMHKVFDKHHMKRW